MDLSGQFVAGPCQVCGGELRPYRHAWLKRCARCSVLNADFAVAIPDFKSGWVRQLCRTPDGGFVVLCQLSGNYTIRDQVSRYDRDGKLVSSKTEPGYGQGDLYKDICVLEDGSVAALIAVPDIVKIYRPGAAATCRRSPWIS